MHHLSCHPFTQAFGHKAAGVGPGPPPPRARPCRLKLVMTRLPASRRLLGPVRPAGGARPRPAAGPGKGRGRNGRAGALASLPGRPWGCRPRSGTTRLTSAATHTHTQAIKPKGQGGKKRATEFQAILARRQEGTVMNIPPDEADTLPWAPPSPGAEPRGGLPSRYSGELRSALRQTFALSNTGGP